MGIIQTLQQKNAGRIVRILNPGAATIFLPTCNLNRFCEIGIHMGAGRTTQKKAPGNIQALCEMLARDCCASEMAEPWIPQLKGSRWFPIGEEFWCKVPREDWQKRENKVRRLWEKHARHARALNWRLVRCKGRFALLPTISNIEVVKLFITAELCRGELETHWALIDALQRLERISAFEIEECSLDTLSVVFTSAPRKWSDVRKLVAPLQDDNFQWVDGHRYRYTARVKNCNGFCLYWG